MASTDDLNGPQSPNRFLAVSEAPKKSNTKRKSSWLSTKMSRNSSMTSKSRSIPIFVHVGDLLKHPGGSPKFSPDQDNNEDISQVEPDPEQSPMGTSRTIPTGPRPDASSALNLAKQSDKDASQVGLSKEQIEKAPGSGETKPKRNTKSIYSSFPEPPDPLEHFDKWFPESPQTPPVEEKQKARVDKSLPQPPYHVFDSNKKMQLVILVSLAGILSPLSTSIYLPALAPIATEFKVSEAVVMLTLTVFMVFQGIAPFFWMPICNTLGRRPVFIITLIIFAGANIGLVFSKSFAALMVLRAIQSIGSAALTATCAAVIGDISTSKERGRFIGLFGGVLMFTFISPVLGGILTHWMGFRSIFWFLFALGSLVLILIIMILPETLRSIAGNGTIRLKPIQQPLVNLIRSSSDTPFDSSNISSFGGRTKFLGIQSLLEPLQCLSQKDVLATTFVGSIAFAVCTMVITTTGTMFETHYQFSIFVIGLAFLPAGAGSMLSFFLMGYLMDHDLRVVEAQYREMYDLEKNTPLDHKTLADFPIERARLRNAWWITLIFIGTTAAYGFSFSGTTIAGPLILQFFIASSATAFLLLNGVLTADLFKGYGSVTLAVNLVRFLVGAVAVGVVQLALDKIGNGFTFLTIAMAMLALTPMMVIQWVFGKPWRARRDSTWPRRKLTADLGLPDFGYLAKRIVTSVKSVRFPDIRAMSSETANSIKNRWPR